MVSSDEWKSEIEHSAETIEQYRAVSDELLAELATAVRNRDVMRAMELQMVLIAKTDLLTMLVEGVRIADTKAKQLDSTLN